VEEETQLEALSRALPRGGRVAPKLLDTFTPAEPEAAEAALQRLVAALGAGEGLAEALELRAAVRSAAREIGPHASAGFALDRLDRKMQNVLSLWFDPGFLQVQRIGEDSAAEVREAAAAVAHAVSPDYAVQLIEGSVDPHHRCFALRHAQMDPHSPPLLVAHASLANTLPSSLAEVVLPGRTAEAPQAACLWALGAPPSIGRDGSLHGLGLGQVLRREVCRQLRTELPTVASGGGSENIVGALVPLRGFAAWLHACRAWERPGIDEAAAGALQRAVQGGGRGLRREVQFADEDGDNVTFRLVQAEGTSGQILETISGEGPPRRILKLVVAEQGRALRFLVEPGPEALQVNVAEEAVARGDPVHVGHLAEAAGLLPASMRDVVLRLAYDFIIQRRGNGCHAAERATHFHLSGGAALHALHWRGDESAAALSDSLGIMASFVYRGPDAESEAAQAYAAEGLDAATFTAGGL